MYKCSYFRSILLYDAKFEDLDNEKYILGNIYLDI